MFRCAILDNPHDLQRIRPLWEELCLQPEMTIFQSYSWVTTALTVFAEREQPRLLYVENDNGAALLPIVQCRHCGTLYLAGEQLFDYRDALFVGDTAILSAAWARIAEWDRPLKITALRGDGARSRWSNLPVQSFANAPFVSFAKLTCDDFVGAHNRMGRYARRFRRQGISLRQHSGANRALIRRIYENKAAQDVHTSLFRDPLRREFMLAIAALPDAGFEIFTYETAGELVAAIVTFRDGGTRRFYTTYFDRRWAAQSPGQVLLFEVTAQCLKENLDCDYMTGEYPYKNRFANDKVPLYQVKAEPAQLRSAAADSAGPAFREPLVA